MIPSKRQAARHIELGDDGLRSAVARLAHLSTARQRLLTLMRQLHYGRIEGLTIENADPVLNPWPKVVQDIKLGCDSPQPDIKAADYQLKTQVIEFFDYLDRLGTGSISLIEVKGGLPFKIEALVEAEQD